MMGVKVHLCDDEVNMMSSIHPIDVCHCYLDCPTCTDTERSCGFTEEQFTGASAREHFGQLDRSFDARQPEILGYVMSEDAATLGEAEAEMLLYVATVFWQAAERKKGQKMPEIAAEDLDRLQDENWKYFDDQERANNMDMAAFLDPIIEAYAEPELLYYILDIFEEDDDGNEEFSA